MAIDISAVTIFKGTPEFPGKTIVQLSLTGYTGNAETGIMISHQLQNVDEIEHAVEAIIKEAKKAGGVAKRMLAKSNPK